MCVCVCVIAENNPHKGMFYLNFLKVKIQSIVNLIKFVVSSDFVLFCFLFLFLFLFFNFFFVFLIFCCFFLFFYFF